MSSSPSISVIVPVFNAAPFLAAALDSIAAQSVTPHEIIVVDDGSTDDSAQVALDWSRTHNALVLMQVVQQTNSGPAAARNAGLQAAQGDLIVFLDADDLWPSHALQSQIEIWEHLPNRNQSIVMGLTQLFTQPRGTDKVSHGSPFRFLNVGSALFPARVFEQCGCFDPALRASEDVDWFLRARDGSFDLCSHEAVTLWHRRHEANMTRGQSLQHLNFHHALKRSLDRRRAAGCATISAPFEAQLQNNDEHLRNP